MAEKTDTVLFQDDFSNLASGWVAEKTDYGEFAYADGEFRILLNKANFNTHGHQQEHDHRGDNLTLGGGDRGLASG